MSWAQVGQAIVTAIASSAASAALSPKGQGQAGAVETGQPPPGTGTTQESVPIAAQQPQDKAGDLNEIGPVRSPEAGKSNPWLDTARAVGPALAQVAATQLFSGKRAGPAADVRFAPIAGGGGGGGPVQTPGLGGGVPVGQLLAGLSRIR